MHIFIRNYSAITHPLTRLTCKDIDFEFGPDEIKVQECLKHVIVTSPAIRPIDYDSDAMVYLSVDTSYIAIGYVITQDDPDKPIAHLPVVLDPCFSTHVKPSIPS